MTASKKVLLAAAMVSAGYGLATLFGPPKAVHLSWRGLDSAERDHQSITAARNQSDGSLAPGLWALGAARLVPDTPTAEPVEVPAGETPLPLAVRPPTSSSLPLADVVPPLLTESATPIHQAPTSNGALAPIAKLRNEAPRPLIVEPHTPVVKTLEPTLPRDAEPMQMIQLSDPADQTSTGIANVRFTDDPLLRSAAPASYERADAPYAFEAIAPPSLPPSDDIQEPRRHIIVDGDSLARLAGRYLDDPHRGEEIYQLNRHLLSDPELLPIGAEIDIPPRNAAHSRGQLPQSYLPQTGALHAAVRGGLVPVRPVPASASLMPRAQLSGPMPVD